MLEAVTLSELQDHVILARNSDERQGEDRTDKEVCLLRTEIMKLHTICMIAGVLVSSLRNLFSNLQLMVFGISPEDTLAASKALNPQVYIKDLSTAMQSFLEQEWIKISSFLNPVGKNFLKLLIIFYLKLLFLL